MVVGDQSAEVFDFGLVTRGSRESPVPKKACQASSFVYIPLELTLTVPIKYLPIQSTLSVASTSTLSKDLFDSFLVPKAWIPTQLTESSDLSTQSGRVVAVDEMSQDTGLFSVRRPREVRSISLPSYDLKQFSSANNCNLSELTDMAIDAWEHTKLLCHTSTCIGPQALQLHQQSPEPSLHFTTCSINIPHGLVTRATTATSLPAVCIWKQPGRLGSINGSAISIKQPVPECEYKST